jgi:hypothetical protein
LSRLIRSVTALALLLAALVGVPAALVALRGSPVPGTISVRSVFDALLQPDDGSVLLGLITAVAWLAWAVFAVSVLTELLALATRQRVRIRLPGLAGPQRVAAGLILAVLALAAAPTVPHPGPVAAVAQAAPRPAATPSTSPAQGQPAGSSGEAGLGRETTPAAGRTHVVRPGDDLWSLAEHYYGEGREWRRIATANPGVLTGGPDRLTPGWRLVIPEADGAQRGDDAGQVRVRRGDTLSGIADRELGERERWPELFRANRAQLDDPDELETGMRLVLPGRAAPVPAAPDIERRATPEPGADVQPDVQPGAPPAPTGRTVADPRSVGAPAPQPPAPGAGLPSEAADATVPEAHQERDATLPLGAVGGLLAAGVVAGLAARRRRQLQTRPVGRRIPHPPASARPAEAALGRRQRPLTLRSLDRALRSIGASCRTAGLPLPPLQLAIVGEERIEFVLARSCPEAPVGFAVEGRSWVLDAAGAAFLGRAPGVAEALRPWPALVTLGRDRQDRPVLADLEGLGLLEVRAPDPGDAAGVLAALAVELSFSPWAEEMTLTLLGADDRLPDALGQHGVQRAAGPEELLQRLERRAADQRRHQPHEVLGQHRLDPDLADPWAPEIVLVSAELTPAQRRRLQDVVCAAPRVTTAAVVLGDHGAEWSLRLDGGRKDAAVLQPLGLQLHPQSLPAPEADSVLQLVEATGRTDTTPAPWWAADDDPDPPPGNVTYLGRRFGGWAAEGREGDEVAQTAAGSGWDAVAHPTLMLLGPVELLGAAGTVPPRAGRQCLEYCAWLLEFPGRTAHAMASALAVAEGTRRSNMSRLRSWLGESAEGEAYLPDAYTGRISLHPAVSSDWQRLQILTATGVNRASTEALRAALQLVRGAPLADAAPGQWHWAEELRTDMISCVRDTGVELARRALEDGDLDLARWAAARALAAAPGDELLVATRIRTEHLAGNPAETERLTLQLAAQARRLGVDLDPATVTLLQEVMEGQVRARLA